MKNCPHCGKDLEAIKWEYDCVPVLDWFADFWSLYPRKVAKASALKAFKKAATSEAIKDEIMLGLSQQIPRFRDLMSLNGHQFIPHPATWLNGQRWLDEWEQSPQKPLSEHERWLQQRRADLLRYEQVNGHKPS